jgi:hypothetical protein
MPRTSVLLATLGANIKQVDSHVGFMVKWDDLIEEKRKSFDYRGA